LLTLLGEYIDLTEPCLDGADFSSTFRRFDFSNASMRGASFKSAHLSWGKFESADLTRADFTNADLSNADFNSAILVEATLDSAILDGANLSGAIFKPQGVQVMDLTESDSRMIDLSERNLAGWIFREADLRNANFKGADLSDADLTHADLRGADFRDATLTRAKLLRAITSNQYWQLEQGYSGHNDDASDLADFRGADLVGTRDVTFEQLSTSTWDDSTKLTKKLRRRLKYQRRERALQQEGYEASLRIVGNIEMIEAVAARLVREGRGAKSDPPEEKCNTQLFPSRDWVCTYLTVEGFGLLIKVLADAQAYRFQNITRIWLSVREIKGDKWVSSGDVRRRLRELADETVALPEETAEGYGIPIDLPLDVELEVLEDRLHRKVSDVIDQLVAK